ncbi:translation initiation factor [Robiginitalea biformata]|uniref:SUI1 domain-containing protein n=1 Tax=Robiginitalea biformata (strain ATCC BAA-864 / DSM 15991 / KCTC 12146 / HTCC2501) TaxID=313596 RepID=A4CL34_ROBBH|nr:translation initiation factor [Robiginitalea biformata]EAR15583.1 hypothetical protein RB2501_14684 [Robiginitalea biformata HTCC2501]
MDLRDQLKNLFPDHEPEPESESDSGNPDPNPVWLQEDPIRCIYEKRRGKPVTVLEGYTGADSDFASLTREIKKHLGVGGSYKDDRILIQGDCRDQIMQLLKSKGFNVKRVGG